MLERISQICVSLLDPILLPVLGRSWWLAVAMVALLTAIVLTLARKFGTNQDLLRRVASDKKRIAQRLKDAKRQGDKPLRKELKLLKNVVGLRAMGQEMRAMVLSVLPIVVIACWCYGRLEFHPIAAGQPFAIELYTPAWAIGEPVFIRPVEGINMADASWLRVVEKDPTSPPTRPNGLAKWDVASAGMPSPAKITWAIRRMEPFEQEFRVGSVIYDPPVAQHAEEFVSQVVLPKPGVFGFTGFGALLPFWLVVYLVIAIPGAFLVRKLLRVA